jgi:hypothetical protein
MGWLDDFLDTFGLTQSELDEELASDEVLKGRIELANEVRDYWKSVSPVGDPETDPHSGQYRDSIEVEVNGQDVKVVAQEDKAHLIEWGSAHNAEYAPRAKAYEHFARPS